MDLNLILVCVAIIVTLFFSYTNGFRDTANAIAASIPTRTRTPRTALLTATVTGVIDAMMDTAIAKAIDKGIILISDCAGPPMVEIQRKDLVTTLITLLGACIWNLITWWSGLPSSSSRVLIDGMMGAGLISSTVVHWQGVMSYVAIPTFTSPIIGFVIGYTVMKIVLWTLRKA